MSIILYSVCHLSLTFWKYIIDKKYKEYGKFTIGYISSDK